MAFDVMAILSGGLVDELTTEGDGAVSLTVSSTNSET
jgi:hypothetical protein